MSIKASTSAGTFLGAGRLFFVAGWLLSHLCRADLLNLFPSRATTLQSYFTWCLYRCTAACRRSVLIVIPTWYCPQTYETGCNTGGCCWGVTVAIRGNPGYIGGDGLPFSHPKRTGSGRCQSIACARHQTTSWHCPGWDPVWGRAMRMTSCRFMVMQGELPWNKHTAPFGTWFMASAR